MSKPKVFIPTEKIAELSAFVAELAEHIERAKTDFIDEKSEGINMEGWPTLVRGLQFVLDHTQKLARPASKLHTMNAEKLLLPGMKTSPTKRSTKKPEKAIKSTETEVKAGRKKKAGS